MQKTLQFDRGGSTPSPLYKSLLSGLDPEQLAPFLAQAVPRNFTSGQLIQQHGDSANGCWVVETGRVKLGRISPSGAFAALVMVGPGESYGELALLRGEPRLVDAIATEQTRLHWIDAGHFDRILAQRPNIMRELLRLLGDQLQSAMLQLVAARGARAEQRLAGLLASMAAGTAAETQIALTQLELAELSGLTRVTVGTLLARFERLGALRRSYGRITIYHAAMLAAIAAQN